VEMLESERGDAQRDDSHQGNHLWCSPDHPSIRYDTIENSCDKPMFHVHIAPIIAVPSE
jgi:hypothetical protein